MYRTFFQGLVNGIPETHVSIGDAAPDMWAYDIREHLRVAFPHGYDITGYVVVQDSDRNVVAIHEITIVLIEESDSDEG